MSNVSVTSSKRELITSELIQEVESIRAMNSSLRAYLEHLKTFRENITTMDKNYKNLSKVNSEWMDLLNKK